MTANGTTGGLSPMATLMALLHKTGRLVRKIMLGGLFLLAAGIVALATAFLGILVTIAALLFRFSGRGGPAAATRTAKASQTRRDGSAEPVTLEARQTGEGWTVE